MSDEDRIRENAVRLRFRLGGLTTEEAVEAQNFINAQEKELKRARKARQDDVLPSEDELRARFDIPQEAGQ